MLRILPALVLLSFAAAVHAADRPNILLIMADDIGIEGLGCYGGTSYRTPNLDRLAGEGVRFTHAFSQPLCTPTRVQIMTGKYNHRNWRYFGILDPSETTFGHRMQRAGYTTGIFGKWQLQSYDPPDLPGADARRGTGMHPKDAGFDRYALYHSLHTEDKGSRYANPSMLEGKAGQEGQLKTYSGKYGEDIWVDKIVDFFDDNREKPTFVYYPMALPHWPFEPTPDSDDWDPDSVPEQSVKYFGDMVEYMDKTVGNLIDRLKRKGHLENTLVLFYSDNGTDIRVVSQVADGREIQGGKATSKQTGFHVPLIANWPGRLKPDVCDDLVDASDFVPTLLEIAQQDPAKELKDGISFAPVLLGKKGPVREASFIWYDPRPGWDKERFRRHVFAVDKRYKLYRDGRLFRLTEQPLEQIEVDPLNMTSADQEAQKKLGRVIVDALAGVDEPPLVDAYGKRQHDFLFMPKDRAETDRIGDELLAQGTPIHYGDPDIAQQKLWIFPPLDALDDERRPCVFLVHGGGWGGQPRALAPQAVYLQRLGYSAVVVHFRPPSKAGKKSPKPVTPHDTLADVRAAYRWVVRHAGDHHIDPEKIVVSGGSAGGHLSLAMCTIGLKDDPVVSPLPKGLVLFNPVIDLVDGWPSGRKKCESFGIDVRGFSPAHQVTASLPPTLILSGSKDSLIPPELIRRFQERMTSKGNQTKFVEYPDAGHGFFNYGREENRYFRWTMWEFERFLDSLNLR